MKILVDENPPLRLPKELADLAYHELLADERIEIAPEPMNLERSGPT